MGGRKVGRKVGREEGRKGRKYSKAKRDLEPIQKKNQE